MQRLSPFFGDRSPEIQASGSHNTAFQRFNSEISGYFCLNKDRPNSLPEDPGIRIMFSSCKIIDDHRIQEKLFTRYQRKLDELREEGFEFAGVIATTHSALLMPVTLSFGVIGREVWNINCFGEVRWYHPLMRSADGETVVYPTGVGLRFYTFFEDGTAQRTTNALNQTSGGYMRRCQLYFAHVVAKTAGDAWHSHRSRCDQRNNDGLRSVQLECLDRFTSLQSDEDSPLDMLGLAAVAWAVPFGLVTWLANNWN